MTNGEIWLIDFGEPFGSEAAFKRPAVIVQNNELNKSDLNTIVVVPLTTNIRYAEYKGNVFCSKSETSLPKDSVAMTAQIIGTDKVRFIEKWGVMPKNLMSKIYENISWTLNMSSELK